MCFFYSITVFYGCYVRAVLCRYPMSGYHGRLLIKFDNLSDVAKRRVVHAPVEYPGA